MPPDLRTARRHIEYARDILSDGGRDTRKLREALELAVEAILHLEHRRQDEASGKVIWFPFSRVRSRKHLDG